MKRSLSDDEKSSKDDAKLKLHQKLVYYSQSTKKILKSSFTLHHTLRMVLMLAVFIVGFLIAEQIGFLLTLSSCSWPYSPEDPQSCDRVLILSDIHVLGGREAMWPLTLDTDHYLGSFLTRILAKYSPNTVVFLGDALHEGWYKVTSDSEYKSIADRFKSSITSKLKDKEVLVLMGNHDAGDYLDPNDSLVHRWEDQFGPSSYSKTIKGVNYQVINSISIEHVWNATKTFALPSDPICLTHYPIYTMNPPELRSYLRQNCRYILSGHEHVFNVFYNETIAPAFSPNRIEGNHGFMLALISPTDISFRRCNGSNRNHLYFITSVLFFVLIWNFVGKNVIQKRRFKLSFMFLLALEIVAYFVSISLNLEQVFIPLNYVIISSLWILAWDMNSYFTIVFILANFLGVVFSMGFLKDFNWAVQRNGLGIV